MTLTGFHRGDNGNDTTATTLACSPDGGAIPVGSLAVLIVAYDNAGTNGADPYVSISDAHGNPWTARDAGLNDPGAANAGICLRFFTALLATQLETTDVVTVTFSPTVVAKSYQFKQATGSVGVPTYKTGAVANAAAGSGTTASITTGTINSGNMIITAIANEWDTSDVPAGDADTTNGTWSTIAQKSSGASTSASVSTASQRKIVTATATQSWDLTSNPDVDRIVGWIEIEEIVSGSAFVPRIMVEY